MAIRRIRIARPKTERRVPIGASTSTRRLLAVLDEIQWAPGLNGHGRIEGERFHFAAIEEAAQRLRELFESGIIGTDD